jgi:hypothetical protein
MFSQVKNKLLSALAFSMAVWNIMQVSRFFRYIVDMWQAGFSLPLSLFL